MMPFRLAWLWWSIGTLLVLLDIVLSLAPSGAAAPLVPDKVTHFSTYFLLAFWFVSLAARKRFTAVTAVIALGGVLELLQGLTPARQPEWLDLFANTAGALLAFCTVMLLPFNVFAVVERFAGQSSR